ncbi:hypothetical protein [Blastococcus brunescens]|uniref:Lipoprotein n=1 Tax=Blastococcus brunescens TaxID=1564165 RepID=A0ABZ1AUP0_9ACTN|nr:hypothetical protein [Blastococcus sp. BMG 8361]WRL62272.1 hypothetical protein U6N30_19820 [Blastococcus sp. BMG 8361]
MAGVLVGTALLTGCSEKQEANDTLPSSSAAETSEALPQLGPADFPVPDEARTKDAAGAEAFLRYWIELIDHQRAIPAGQPLRDLGLECDECLRIAKVYDDAAAEGQRFEGGELTLNDVPSPVLNGDVATINFGAAQSALALVDRNGVVLEGLSAEANLPSGITLSWSPDDKVWRATGFNIG